MPREFKVGTVIRYFDKVTQSHVDAVIKSLTTENWAVVKFLHNNKYKVIDLRDVEVSPDQTIESLINEAITEGAHDYSIVLKGNMTIPQIIAKLRQGNHSSDPYSDEAQLGSIQVKEVQTVSKEYNAALDELLNKAQKWEPLLAAKITTLPDGKTGDFWLVAGWLAE